jgi:hypothetical protein
LIGEQAKSNHCYLTDRQWGGHDVGLYNSN